MDFQICLKNQDNTPVEGLLDYNLVLEFGYDEIPSIHYMHRIFMILSRIFLWVSLIADKMSFIK